MLQLNKKHGGISHLRSCLREPENVVDEEKHVLSLLVAEVLGNGQPGEGHTRPGARGLVHLAVHQRHLGALVLEGDDAALNHLVVEVVALPGPLADAGEHGVASVGLGHVVDQLHDEHGLAHAGAAEQADLAALGVGGQQVNHLRE